MCRSAPQEVASENKLKDKKVIAIFCKKALSNCASPTMHSDFSEDHLHTGGEPPW